MVVSMRMVKLVTTAGCFLTLLAWSCMHHAALPREQDGHVIIMATKGVSVP